MRSGLSSIPGWITDDELHLACKRCRVMETSYLVAVNIATFVLLVVAAYGLGEARKPGKEPDAEAVTDVYGKMHVPEGYC